MQKLIHEEMSYLYDVGCIWHFADLAIKAGISKLLIEINQLLLMFSMVGFSSQPSRSGNAGGKKIPTRHLSHPVRINHNHFLVGSY